MTPAERPTSIEETELHLVSVEHFDGDGRCVTRVWQTFHWIELAPGEQLPDRVDVRSLRDAVPEVIYSHSGRALR